MLDLNTITNKVSSYYQVTKEAVLSPTHAPHTVRARHMAIYLSRNFTHMGYKSLGRYFRRNHTSIMHACTKLDQQSLTDPEVAKDLMALKEVLTRIAII